MGDNVKVVKTALGLPLNLFWGYVAIALFMTGDGFDLAFLSHYITTLGFTRAESSLVFTVYGFTAALSAWCSGVVAELITAKRAMMLGFVLWVLFHVCFLYFGLSKANYSLIVLFYGLRGIAYPLFLYSFVVAIVQNVHASQISGAMGWFWTIYSIGIGVAGSYIPSFTIPVFGEYGTLWCALVFVGTGGIISAVLLRGLNNSAKSNLSVSDKLKELTFAVTLFKNPHVTYAAIIRVINTLSLFGFAVIMPMMFVDELHFTTEEWLRIWGVFFFTTIFSNVFWGVAGEKWGWMRIIRWAGCMGMFFSTLIFYYMPQYFGHSFAWAMVPAICMGIFVGGFVAITPILTTLEPEHKGAAISVYNLAAGASNFLAPAIASLVLPYFGVQGVVHVYAALYAIAFTLTFVLKVKQPKATDVEEVGSANSSSQDSNVSPKVVTAKA